MNLPNKLTLMRIILVPFFMLFLYWNIPYHFTIALVIFAAAVRLQMHSTRNVSPRKHII